MQHSKSPKFFDLILVFSVVLVVQFSIHVINGEEGEIIKFLQNVKVPGKISKLFPVHRSRVWKVSKNSIGVDNGINDFGEKGQAVFVRDTFDKDDDESEGDKLLKKTGQNSGELSTWTDLSKALGEEKIKTFLNTLPLDVLRNVTSLTRQNPQLGEKKLIQLFMERNLNTKFGNKERNEIYGSDNSQSQNEQNVNKSMNDDVKQLEFQIYRNSFYSTTNPINNANARTTAELEIPKYQENLPDPNPPKTINMDYPLHNTTVFSFHNSDKRQKSAGEVNDSPNVRIDFHKVLDNPIKPGSSLTNSGYYLPEITTSIPLAYGNSDANSKYDFDNLVNNHNPNMIPSKPWNKSEPQNPINTFNPNVDDFLNPPVDNQDHELDHDPYIEEKPIHPNNEYNSDNTGISNEADGRFEEMEQLNIKLLPAASNTNGGLAMIMNDGYGYNNYQKPEHEYIEQNPSSDYVNYNSDEHYKYSTPNSNSHYIHQHEPPLISNFVTQPQNTIQQTYKQRPEDNEYNKLNANQYYTNFQENPTQNQRQPQLSQPQQRKPERSPPHAEMNPDSGIVGWGSLGSHDWGPSEIWNSLKTYMTKSGTKSTAEKVFEVSICILSFLAFGGYLVMLFYQVFALATAVPMFPGMSPTVGRHTPTWFELMFGRNMESDGSYRFNPNEVMNGKYIEELERIVKTAMDKVKTKWSDVVVEHVIGDLGQ